MKTQNFAPMRDPVI